MTTTYTKYYRFALPDFRMGPWHDLINEDIIRIDELLYGIDSGGDPLSAVDIIFDPTITGLPATNVQAALDFLWLRLQTLETTVSTIQSSINAVWASARNVPIAFPFSGAPSAAVKVNVPIAIPLIVQAGLSGSVTYADVLATGSVVFNVNRISGGSTVSLGTVTFSGVSHTGTISGPGGTLAVGDVLQIVSPVIADATLADVGISIFTMRA